MRDEAGKVEVAHPDFPKMADTTFTFTIPLSFLAFQDLPLREGFNKKKGGESVVFCHTRRRGGQQKEKPHCFFGVLKRVNFIFSEKKTTLFPFLREGSGYQTGENEKN